LRLRHGREKKGDEKRDREEAKKQGEHEENGISRCLPTYEIRSNGICDKDEPIWVYHRDIVGNYHIDGNEEGGHQRQPAAILPGKKVGRHVCPVTIVEKYTPSLLTILSSHTMMARVDSEYTPRIKRFREEPIPDVEPHEALRVFQSALIAHEEDRKKENYNHAKKWLDEGRSFDAPLTYTNVSRELVTTSLFALLSETTFWHEWLVREMDLNTLHPLRDGYITVFSSCLLTSKSDQFVLDLMKRGGTLYVRGGGPILYPKEMDDVMRKRVGWMRHVEVMKLLLLSLSLSPSLREGGMYLPTDCLRMLHEFLI
jgi:hypothetical protein